MTVYVDDLALYGSWKYGKSCHMTCSGSFDELHALAEKIGLKRAWFQSSHVRPTLWHYDCTASKRALAVQHGAVEVTSREYSSLIHVALQRSRRRAFCATPVDMKRRMLICWRCRRTTRGEQSGNA